MSTIAATVSIMEELPEEARIKVLNYAQDLCETEKPSNPFMPLTKDQILADLGKSRQQISDGHGVSASETMERIGKKHGFI